MNPKGSDREWDEKQFRYLLDSRAWSDDIIKFIDEEILKAKAESEKEIQRLREALENIKTVTAKGKVDFEEMKLGPSDLDAMCSLVWKFADKALNQSVKEKL